MKPNRELQECIDDCEKCHRTCLRMAVTHCLAVGGRHVEQEHFHLMLDCIDICRVAADFMLRESTYHPRICGVCADICDSCAESCSRLDGMQECVKDCRRCAESCRAMAAETV